MIEYGWYDFVGNIGAAPVVGSYPVLQAGRMRADDARYSVLNAPGSLLILFFIKCVWLAISIYGLVRRLVS